MKTKKLKTLQEFKNLKKGDVILVNWGEAPRKAKKIMLYHIPKVQHEHDEIICNVKLNHYFNYKMHLGLDTIGKCTSNAKVVYLIESDGE